VICRWAALLLVVGLLVHGSRVCAQETQLGADFRGEGERFSQSCAKFSVVGCATLLFTDHPLHIAVGSLAPENGFGGGLAFTSHYTPNENWRLFFNADAVATLNQSWRAGAYATAVRTKRRGFVAVSGGSKSKKKSSTTSFLTEDPVLHVYSQATSLSHIDYYGLGQATPRTPFGFGMTEVIGGGNLVWPVFKPLNLSLLGEVNGRAYSLRSYSSSTVDGLNSSGPYAPPAAPGFIRSPSYAQFGGGVRVAPVIADGFLNLDYTAAYQDWLSMTGGYSFQRFTANLDHEFPLYRHMASAAPREFNPPDSCSLDADKQKCPAVTLSRNLEGSIGFRFLWTSSYTSNGNVVPFFVDPTLGGSDINGVTLLPSYADYRFRGPDLMLLRGSFEHSLGKLPVGFKFLVDEGRVGLHPGDLGFSNLAHSYAAGLTLHAGGLPVVDLLFAWGGKEGTHTIANVSNSLLGGTTRPSLY
jgi:hypothetical protein